MYKKAKGVLGSRQLSKDGWAGSVAVTLLTDTGNVYLDLCIDVTSGMGFCAEHAAIAAMITAGENKIDKIVAVGKNGVLPPCGRCREFINQVHDENMSTLVMVTNDKIVTLRELLPFVSE